MQFVTNYIYLYHTDKFIIIPEYPESITDNMTLTFNQTQALSRSAPVFTYAYSGPRSVTFNLLIGYSPFNVIRNHRKYSNRYQIHYTYYSPCSK